MANPVDLSAHPGSRGQLLACARDMVPAAPESLSPAAVSVGGSAVNVGVLGNLKFEYVIQHTELTSSF